MMKQKTQRIFAGIMLGFAALSAAFLVASIRANSELSVPRLGPALLLTGLFSQGFALLLTGRNERLINVLRVIGFIAVLLSLATWVVPR